MPEEVQLMTDDEAITNLRLLFEAAVSLVRLKYPRVTLPPDNCIRLVTALPEQEYIPVAPEEASYKEAKGLIWKIIQSQHEWNDIDMSFVLRGRRLRSHIAITPPPVILTPESEQILRELRLRW